MEDSESVGSSPTSDDQSATSSQTESLKEQLDSASNLSAKLQKLMAFSDNENCTTLAYSSDLESSDTSSVGSAGNNNCNKPRSRPADHSATPTKRTPRVHQLGNYEKSLIRGAHLSNEHVRLTSLLKSTSSKRIVGVIDNKLRQKDSRTIVALSVLFPRSEFPAAPDSRHCARCHKSFDPFDNELDEDLKDSTNPCVIRHPNAAVTKIGEDAGGTRFHCMSCKANFLLPLMDFYNEHVNSYLAPGGGCFSGAHTENPCQVAYGGAVHTCEENGCVEFYV